MATLIYGFSSLASAVILANGLEKRVFAHNMGVSGTGESLKLSRCMVPRSLAGRYIVTGVVSSKGCHGLAVQSTGCIVPCARVLALATSPIPCDWLFQPIFDLNEGLGMTNQKYP